MLADARERGYAVGYFEAWDIYSLEAVVGAAEDLCAPVIIGFGGLMIEPQWFKTRGLAALGNLGHTVACRAAVPVSLILNEARSFDEVVRGIARGFNAVMLDSAHLPPDEHLALTRQVVAVSHPLGVAVEAEVGSLPEASGTGDLRGEAVATDPDQAAEFVRQTGVDALGVSVGNVHMMVDAEAAIDLCRLEELNQAVDVPLVIHGGSSFPRDAVAEAIAHGVAKFNVGTVLKKVFLEGVEAALGAVRPGMSIQQRIGTHGDGDVLSAGKERMRAQVSDLIRLYGSAGRASGFARR
jgi:fructose-bisphosphate aldolase class II